MKIDKAFLVSGSLVSFIMFLARSRPSTRGTYSYSYISRDESEIRIIWIESFIAFWLAVTSGIFLALILFYKYSNNEPVIVYPTIPKDVFGKI